MKVLGVEQLVQLGNSPSKLIGLVLTPGTEVRRGDIIIVSKIANESLKSCGEATVCNTVDKGVRLPH